MTELNTAFKFVAAGDPLIDTRKWNEAIKTIEKAGFCPECACAGIRVTLRPWQEGNAWLNAGRECPECENFVVSGMQPEYVTDSGPSDADPGL